MPLRTSPEPRELWTDEVITSSAEASESIGCEHYDEAQVFIKVTAKVGTTPTVTLVVQTSHDDSDWHLHTSVPQIADPTLTSYETVVSLTNIGKYLRIRSPGLSSGTSMTVTATVVLKG